MARSYHMCQGPSIQLDRPLRRSDITDFRQGVAVYLRIVASPVIAPRCPSTSNNRLPSIIKWTCGKISPSLQVGLDGPSPRSKLGVAGHPHCAESGSGMLFRRDGLRNSTHCPGGFPAYWPNTTRRRAIPSMTP